MKLPAIPKRPKASQPVDPILQDMQTDYRLIPHGSPLRRQVQKKMYGGVLSPYVKLLNGKTKI